MLKISNLFLFFTVFNGAILLAMDNQCRPFDDSSESSELGEEVAEEPFEEWSKKLDLDNFPDPCFLPLAAMNIYSEEDFINYWQKKTGRAIRSFASFTAPKKS